MMQRVLVISSASGKGKEIARACVAKGARVCVCDIDVTAMETAAKDIPGLIFVTALVVGFFASPPASQQVKEAFQVFVDRYRDRTGGALFFFILLHNAMVSLLLVDSGLLFGIIRSWRSVSTGLSSA